MAPAGKSETETAGTFLPDRDVMGGFILTAKRPSAERTYYTVLFSDVISTLESPPRSAPLDRFQPDPVARCEGDWS